LPETFRVGIVEMRPGRGAFVTRLSVNDLMRLVDGAVQLEFGAALQLHEVRAMMEIAAARLAATRRSDDDLAAMAAAIAEYADVGDDGNPEMLIEADLRLHKAIVAASRNDMLAQLYESISGLLRQHRRQYASTTERQLREIVISQHRRIHRAIEAGDYRQATAAMQAHMRSIWQQIEQTAIREGDSSLGDQTYLPMYDDEPEPPAS